MAPNQLSGDEIKAVLLRFPMIVASMLAYENIGQTLQTAPEVAGILYRDKPAAKAVTKSALKLIKAAADLKATLELHQIAIPVAGPAHAAVPPMPPAPAAQLTLALPPPGPAPAGQGQAPPLQGAPALTPGGPPFAFEWPKCPEMPKFVKEALAQAQPLLLLYKFVGKVILSWIPKLAIWMGLSVGLLLLMTVATQPILIAKALARACASMPAILAATVQTMLEAFFTELVGGGGPACPEECYQQPFFHGAYPGHTPDQATFSPGQRSPNESAYSRPPTPTANPFWPYLATFGTLLLGQMAPTHQPPVDPA